VPGLSFVADGHGRRERISTGSRSPSLCADAATRGRRNVAEKWPTRTLSSSSVTKLTATEPAVTGLPGLDAASEDASSVLFAGKGVKKKKKRKDKRN